MSQSGVPSFAELLAGTQRSAVHLEMRDMTDYIRWEHAATPLNIEAGELVRWLPRRRAVDIALPGADFWLFDDRLVQFNIFTGDGDWASPPKEFSEDPAVVKLCSDAFEAVWERAVGHEKYTV